MIRAFSIALDQDYKVTMKELFDLGLEMGDLPNSKVVWRKYAEQKGFVRHSTPKDKRGKKVSIRNWSADAPSGSVIALTREHLVAVVDNVQRVIPKDLSVEINLNNIKTLKIFKWLNKMGVNEKEMIKTFNCGVGFCLIANPKNFKLLNFFLNFLGSAINFGGSPILDFL